MTLKNIVICCGTLGLFFSSAVFCKIDVIVDEIIENCTKPGYKAGSMDFSNMEFIAESDTVFYANGKIKFLKPVKAPWKLYSYAEQFVRGKWVVSGYDKKILDFCEVMHNPNETYYKWFQHCPQCPIKVGDECKFDMTDASMPNLPLTSNFAGKWRLTMIPEFSDGSRECWRCNADLVDSLTAG